MRYRLRTFRLRSLFLFLIVVAGACCGLSIYLRNRDASALTGRWEVVYVEQDGSRFVPKELSKVTFDGRVASYTLYGYSFAYTVKMDARRDPRSIDLIESGQTKTREGPGSTNAGSIGWGIYRRSGDVLTLCFGDNQRPVEFSTHRDSGRTIVVLTRTR